MRWLCPSPASAARPSAIRRSVTSVGRSASSTAPEPTAVAAWTGGERGGDVAAASETKSILHWSDTARKDAIMSTSCSLNAPSRLGYSIPHHSLLGSSPKPQRYFRAAQARTGRRSFSQRPTAKATGLFPLQQHVTFVPPCRTSRPPLPPPARLTSSAARQASPRSTPTVRPALDWMRL